MLGLTSARHEDLLRELGATPVIYGDGQQDRIREAAGEAPVSAFIDCYGSGYVDLALALEVPAARINTAVDFGAAQQHGVRTWGTRDAGGTPALSDLADLAARGELVIPIAATFPLGDVIDAYRRVVAPTGAGRVVLQPQR